MSNELTASRIRSNPKYAELVSKRSSFAWILTAIMLTIYFGFILTIAYNKEFLASPLFAGGVTTVGFPIGVGVILSAIILTGIYVNRANGEFDELTKKLIEEAK